MSGDHPFGRRTDGRPRLRTFPSPEPPPSGPAWPPPGPLMAFHHLLEALRAGDKAQAERYRRWLRERGIYLRIKACPTALFKGDRS